MLENSAIPTQDLITVKEVDKLLHVHPNSVRRWSNEGLIKVYRVGPRGDRRFSREDVAAFISQRTGQE